MFWQRMFLEIMVLVCVAVVVRSSERATRLLRVRAHVLALGLLCGLLVLPFCGVWYWSSVVIPRHQSLALAGKHVMSGLELWVHTAVGPVDGWTAALAYCATCAAIVTVWVVLEPRILRGRLPQSSAPSDGLEPPPGPSANASGKNPARSKTTGDD